MSILNESVLILDKHFFAVQVGVAKDAITALCSERAKVIDEFFQTYNLSQWIQQTHFINLEPHNADQYAGKIRSAHIEIYVPQVIQVLNFAGIDPIIRTVKYSRKNVLQRDNYTCQYCGKKFKSSQLTMDHLIPKSKDGKSHWKNIVTSCKDCNNKKGDKSPRELGLKLIKLPEQPTWKSHIGPPFDSVKKKYWNRFL